MNRAALSADHPDIATNRTTLAMPRLSADLIDRGTQMNQFFLRIALAFSLLILIVTYAEGLRADTEDPRPVDTVSPDSYDQEAPTTEKIVGGTPAEPGEYPFQVALIASWAPDGEERKGQFCGGSLIASTWVVTAAHCVPDTKPEEVDVYIGSTVLPIDKNAPGVHGIRMHVTAIVSHDDYDPKNYENDIALLKLEGPVMDQLRPARLPTPEDLKTLFQVGDPVTVIGWGRTSEQANGADRLMQVIVNVQSNSTCQTNYMNYIPSTKITGDMLCAGVPQGGKDSCQGDSGGFLGSKSPDGDWVQGGIVSWGIGCARKDLFGVYTRVSNYLEWIGQVQNEY